MRRVAVAGMEDLWARAAAACDALTEAEGAAAAAGAAAGAAAQLRSVHDRVAAECDALGEARVREGGLTRSLPGWRPLAGSGAGATQSAGGEPPG